MKRIIITMLIITLTLLATPVLAYTPPEQGTDNATDVILWYGNNMTIANANLTIIGLEDAITAAGVAQAQVLVDSQGSNTETYLGMVLVVFIIILAFLPFNSPAMAIFLNSLACLVGILYGLSLAVTQTYGSSLWLSALAIAILGTACLFRAATMGWGQIKRLRRAK